MARKILLADDSVTAQNMGRKILADAGYEVLTVNNGSAALKKIAEAKPELIVLDVYMPGYSGLEVCQRLKEAQETSRIPILLTVGKLEPFKPEEAKRVRADAFIVKPFEASELLSALSKLEDKIVHGRESSKPGRFARANAAIEEGRYDKAMAIEEDSGWKSRIAFPSKKKKKEEEQEDGDDPAIYNALNKDLRTVVEHPAPPAAHQPHEERVNVEALAPEGLPKDVTPEEIAALAAAAAQIKGTVAESKDTEPVAQPPAPVEASAATQVPVNQANIETVDLNIAEIRKAEEAAAEPQAQIPPSPPVIEPEVAKEAEPVPAASIAEAAVESKNEVEKPAEISAVAAAQDASAAPQGAELMAALTSVEPEKVSPANASGNGLGAQEATEEPITMAVAAGAEHAFIPSRWTAVAVALASDEVGISLELEMQKAHAAFAAAETHSAAIVTTPEPPAETPAVAEPPTEQATSETEAPATEAVAPEVSEAATTVASVDTDAIRAAVKELEAVAASYEGHRPFSPETPAPSSVLETTPTSPEKTETEEAPVPTPAPEPEAAKLESEQTPEQPQPEAAIMETKIEEAAPTTQEVSTIEEPPTSAPVDHSLVAGPESSIETPVPSHHTEPESSGKTIAGGTTEMSKKESEIAETTAAAWASWRRIRESGGQKPAPSISTDDNDRPEAAMAVAAGAEKAPEDATEESGEIASIVDSVLADLRPKIVEEISRKLGKKK